MSAKHTAQRTNDDQRSEIGADISTQVLPRLGDLGPFDETGARRATRPTVAAMLTMSSTVCVGADHG
jgi:hypothetical protein